MNYDEAFEVIIGHEGGYDNDPTDRGGETKFGICKRSYPDVDIAALTLEQAKAIYKRDYWDALQLDSLPPGIRLDLFDTAVNSGVGAAAKAMQRVVGAEPDGKIGPKTLDALSAYLRKNGEAMFCVDILLQRGLIMLRLMGRDPSQAKYGGGWANRLEAQRNRAVA